MDIEVRPSKIGLGVFSTKAFKKGEIVVDWSGHPLFQNPPRIDPKYRWTRISPGVYTGPIGVKEHPDAYFNHSCSPNCKVVRDGERILLLALEDIPPGVEMTFDYARIYAPVWSMRCLCGTPACRGVIRGEGPLSRESGGIRS